MYTQVHEEFAEARQNYRLLFGQPTRRRTVNSKDGYTARTNFFAPGARFGLDLWSRNDYGTVRWRCFVCETVRPGESAERVPFVTPAATILSSTKGAAQSRLFLAWLAELPRRHPLVPRYEHHAIRRCVHADCLIFYRVGTEQVDVVHILHGAQDYEPLLIPSG